MALNDGGNGGTAEPDLLGGGAVKLAGTAKTARMQHRGDFALHGRGAPRDRVLAAPRPVPFAARRV